MCGFAGFLTARSRTNEDLEAVANSMAQTLGHRGPDDAGFWVDSSAGVSLGFRRLSINDLTKAGHQPMTSGSGRFVITFNGEIYNHLELRSELESESIWRMEDSKYNWRGHSDTETLLACFERWGIVATLSKTVGMFAIAAWDALERSLYLARDRFGEKPLYYGWVGRAGERAFAFGSELKALRAFPGFENPVCRKALAHYMRFLVVPAPRSIYKGIFKLEPGCVLRITGAPPTEAPEAPLRPPIKFHSLSVQRWWSLAAVVHAGTQHPISNEFLLTELLEDRLSNAVKLQSLADVPLGAFLSGGVDSSTIVALMQQQSNRPVKTFTVGFKEADFDESIYARAVAQHLGTDHTEIYVTPVEAQAVIADLPSIYDEPFADSSQIPTYIVCRAARRHVTVALSGDAGDEMFGGYTRYFWGPRIWAKLSWLPFPVRQMMGAAISSVPSTGWDILSRPINNLLYDSRGIIQIGYKAHRLASRLSSVRDLDDLYLSLVSEWQDPAGIVRGENGPVREPPSLLDDPITAQGLSDSRLRMMYLDSITYLPDDILCKVDRAAMAVSLETRIPFLDHRVAELAWQLPLGMKIRNGEGKWALKQVLYKHVPKKLIDRPKAGFGIPIGQWLRGPLRCWAESLLDENRLKVEGYFHPIPIRKKWDEHLKGERDHTASLWAVLMFQAWLQQQ